MASSKNILIEQGSTFFLSITASNHDGSLKDLSGYTAESCLRRSWFSTTAYPLSASVTGSTGNILLFLSATASAAIPAATYVWDVRVFAGATSQRIKQGNATVDPSVCR
jgi:hypothetical protein